MDTSQIRRPVRKQAFKEAHAGSDDHRSVPILGRIPVGRRLIVLLAVVCRCKVFFAFSYQPFKRPRVMLQDRVLAEYICIDLRVLLDDREIRDNNDNPAVTVWFERRALESKRHR